jgi:uncharacterized membrane protein YeiH
MPVQSPAIFRGRALVVVLAVPVCLADFLYVAVWAIFGSSLVLQTMAGQEHAMVHVRFLVSMRLARAASWWTWCLLQMRLCPRRVWVDTIEGEQSGLVVKD